MLIQQQNDKPDDDAKTVGSIKGNVCQKSKDLPTKPLFKLLASKLFLQKIISYQNYFLTKFSVNKKFYHKK